MFKFVRHNGKTRIHINESVEIKRRVWSPSEEDLLLSLWQKYISQLNAERKHTEVYKQMEDELSLVGVEIEWPKIKAKIESLKRKYKAEARSKGASSEWVYYKRVHDIMASTNTYKTEPLSAENIDITINSDYNDLINEESNTTNSECLKTISSGFGSSIQHTDDTTIPANTNTTVLPTDLGYNNINKVLGAQQEQQMDFEMKTTNCKRTFGDFLANELEVLDEDLIVEAKRKIFNIICDMQIAQIQRNAKADTNTQNCTINQA